MVPVIRSSSSRKPRGSNRLHERLSDSRTGVPGTRNPKKRPSMKPNAFVTAFSLVLGAAALAPQSLAQAPDVKLDRTMLPIPEPDYPHSTVLDARDATPPPRFEVKAPAGRPTCSSSSWTTWASACPAPSAVRCACRLPTASPDRDCVITSSTPPRSARPRGPPSSRAQPPREQHGRHYRNRHGVSGQYRPAPNNVAPLAEMLRLNGYSTGFFGKNHETAPWEVSPSGPTDRWPTRSGFDKFYGFYGGETDQWNPTLYDGMARVPTPHSASSPSHFSAPLLH